jgi:DNA-binding MarR family transcriptional regulator
MIEKKLVEYFSILRDFGRIYTQKILQGNPKLTSDLKLSQIKAIYAFRDRDSFTMKELAENIGAKLPNMTMMIDSLIKEGIVERERDDHDRRRVLVGLTQKGKKIRASFLNQRHTIARSIFANLDENDIRDLMDSLSTLCRVLEKAFKKDLK